MLLLDEKQILPLQTTPLPVNPLLQKHRKLPIVFVHVAFALQLLPPDVHSLMSLQVLLSLSNVKPALHEH